MWIQILPPNKINEREGITLISSERPYSHLIILRILEAYYIYSCPFSINFYYIMLDHGPHPPRSREKKEIRDISTFTEQHVRAVTRAIKCERQWRHVALATAGPVLVVNNMAAYPLRISNSVCPLRISNTCLMSVHTIYGQVESVICYLCFMQHAWCC
jgi:hypothetical protein